MRLLLLVLTSLILLTPLWASASPEIPDDKAVITFDTKMGTVTFNHKLHATVRGIECQSCHHTLKEGEPVKPCSDCHKKSKSKVEGFSVMAPKTKDAFHDKCKGCHQYTMKELKQPAGPTKCKLCHVKE
jgi:hypothetical protein